MAGHGDRDGESASFEGAGRIQAFVFDKDARKFAAGQHGSKTLAERHRRSFRKDGIVAPHGRRQRQKRSRREASLNARQIVARIQNAAIFRANGLWTVGGIMLAATCAFQMSEARHVESLSGVGRSGIDEAEVPLILRASSSLFTPWRSAHEDSRDVIAVDRLPAGGFLKEVCQSGVLGHNHAASPGLPKKTFPARLHIHHPQVRL